MVYLLASRHANSRTEAYNVCFMECADVSLTSMRNNVRRFWAAAGVLGAYTAGSFAYDVWASFGW